MAGGRSPAAGLQLFFRAAIESRESAVFAAAALLPLLLAVLLMAPAVPAGSHEKARGPGENYAVTLLIYVVTACKRRLAVLMRTRDDRGGVRREPADWAPPRRAGAAAAG